MRANYANKWQLNNNKNNKKKKRSTPYRKWASIMTNEMKEIVMKVWKENANKQLSLSTVLATTCAALRADKMGAGSLYAELIGDGGKNKSVRSHFINVFKHEMPHVTYNGTDKEVVVDFVEMDEDKKQNRAIREYRLAGGQAVTLTECVGHIEDTREVNKTEWIKYASGFKREVPSLDSEGKVIKEKRVVKLVPREKTVWGYTDVVMNAFIAALEVVEHEQKH